MSKSFTPPKPPPPPPVGCLDRRDAASYIAISTRLIDDLASKGEIPRIKIGRKTLFRVADLDALIASKIQRLEAGQ